MLYYLLYFTVFDVAVCLRLNCCGSLSSILACCPRSGMRAGGARLMSRCCALLCFQGCRDYFVPGRVRWVRLVFCPSWRSVKRAVACAKLWVFRGWRWLVGSPCIPRWLRTFPRSSVGLLLFRLWGSRPFGRPLYSRGLVAHTSWSATFPALGFLVRCERVYFTVFYFWY